MEEIGIPAYLEKSGGGRGWHVWVFFSEPLPCGLARMLGLHIAPRNVPLTKGGFADPKRSKGIEVFPKQNELKPGKFGNYVWLPWWANAREGANQFFKVNKDGTLESFLPDTFDTASREQVEHVLGQKQGAPNEAPRGNENEDKRGHSKKYSAKHLFAAAAVVRSGCGFFQYCEENQENLEEPAWYALAGISAFLNGGRDLFHELSKRYPNYTVKDTDDKFDQATDAVSGPRTCLNISDHFSGCPQCPHFGAIHSPVEIGTLARANEIAEKLIDQVKSDPGAPFLPESLLALALLKKQDPPNFNRFRAKLQAAKVSMRQLDKALKQCERENLDGDNRNFSRESQYTIENGCISTKKRIDGYEVISPLCNFDAEITSEITQDDGVEKKKCFSIVGTLSDGRKLCEIKVAASDFSGMNWVMQNWGVSAITYPGQITKEHLRTAIQVKSKNAAKVDEFVYTGWRKFDGAGWAYLHGGGAIGAFGNMSEVRVLLGDGRLGNYELPEPPEGEVLKEALSASLRFLELGPIELTAPIFAATYHAPLGPILSNDFSMLIAGRTGVFKSEISAIAQAHYGANFTGRTLPGNWSSTVNSLERQGFLLKDALFIVDDFSPRGGPHDVKELHSKAERLLRGAGNGAGRDRMNREGGLRVQNSPRSLILSTGEDIPKGHSLRARAFILEVEEGAISSERLSLMQIAARDGLLAQAMSGFIKWLAPRIEGSKQELLQQKNGLRATLEKEACHSRTADTTANLIIALRIFFNFANETGCMDEAESDKRFALTRAAVVTASKSQSEHQLSEDQVRRFLALVGGALVARHAYIADSKGMKNGPSEANRWGWVRDSIGSDMLSYGTRIGWIDGNELWLDPEPTFAMLNRVSQGQMDGIALSKNTMGKRLAEKGLIISEQQESSKSARHTTKRTVTEKNIGMRLRCWVFPDKSVLYPYLEDATETKGEFEQHT